ncbi:MAG: phosphopantetheine-binding protein [Clostridiales bacterium]|nr:phosphopantetheine-binding protein [Clostridiales bacterium]
MNRQEQIELLEEMMDLDDENLTEDTILEDIDEYDSFFKLYLVTYVKKELNKRLTVAEIEEFKTVKDICDYLSANE